MKMRETSRVADKKLQDNNKPQGKTFITALFCCVKCILYPGTKVVVTSGTLKQANEVLLKIQDDFMLQSPLLRAEISKCNIGQNDATIAFKNGSWIKTRTSTENSRSARANLLIADEFRMIDENILNTVLRKFLTASRHPGYLNKPEYAHLTERNQEIYMSSAFMKSHWSYRKAQDYTLNFFNDKRKYFIVGLPYQLSIREHLLSREQVEDEMSESSYNELIQAMEMECLWFGDDGDNLFRYDEIEKRRKIKHALLPLRYYTDSNPVPKLAQSERRIMSLDVALMASSKKKKNDAAAIIINSAIQTDQTTYQGHFVSVMTREGLTTDQLGLEVMRLFYKYKCTDLVIDTAGLGLGVYDFIIKDQYDPETGTVLKAMTCINDMDMAKRCRVSDAKRCVWSVKASQKFNSEIALLLRSYIQNGKLDLLIPDQNVDEVLKADVKSYDKLPLGEQTELKMPYVQTTMMEYELIKLEHEVKNGLVSVHEISGMRKDRYSSAAYNIWCMNQLELGLKPKDNVVDAMETFKMRPAKIPGLL